jgi:hypothetical protein
MVRRRPRQRPPWAAVALVLIGPAAAYVVTRAKGATLAQTAVDVGMLRAYRPSRPPPGSPDTPPGYVLLAGDMHCHISPPDVPYHASRGLADTVSLARSEGLDFVGLTPHAWIHELVDPSARAALVQGQRELRRAVAALDTGGLLLTVGAEYTDDSWGHVGMHFGDVGRAIESVTDDEGAGDLSGLFERHVASGGMLVVHHPLLQPVDIPLPGLGLDISWRPFTAPGAAPPAHIGAADRLAVGVEAQNQLVSALRDVLAFGDDQKSLRDVLALIDRQIVLKQRRLVPVGGSDSHSHYTRGLSFVLATARTLPAIREAFLAGRACVRDPSACSLEARAPGGPWQPVGASLLGVREVELRTRQGAQVLLDGAPVLMLEGGLPATLSVPAERCSLVRVVSGGGYSAPIYANCPFASAPGIP